MIVQSLIPLGADIILKLSHCDHSKDLYNAIIKNRKHLDEFLPWVKSMKSEGDFRNYLAHCENDRNNGLELSYNIFKRDELVGRVGLHQIDQRNKHAAIGYWLTKEAEGRGIITKSTSLILQIAFVELRLQRVEILVATTNRKSAAIPMRLKFQKEGTLRHMEKHGDIFFDLDVYSILRPEWQTYNNTPK